MTASRDPPRPTSTTLRIAQRYDAASEIARGGMGVVYEVRDRATGAVIALKRIRADLDGQRAALLSSLEREYQVLASLDHPGIIRVFDYGFDGDQPYYTMELVAGRDLRKLAPTPWREACRLLRDVASALSLLHARRLIHRDLSPGNVKVTPEGRAKLLDFGALADFGYAKWVVGTPPMIAPEVLAGGMLDQRVDLYALGALAYWLMTLRNAYPAANTEDLPEAWRRAPAAPSTFVRGIPASLDALVMSLLSANPLARPGSAAEVIVRLNSIAALPHEEEHERLRLARSFLAAPAFVGRVAQTEAVAQRIARAVAGHGAAVCLEGTAGSGRSRLLEEAGLRAQIAGAIVLRVDASMHGSAHGTSRALTHRLFDALPELAARYGRHFQDALAMLGGGVLARAGEMRADELADITEGRALGKGELADFFLAIAQSKPLVVQIDNAAYVDDVSLGLLATLARAAPSHPLCLMAVTRSDPSGPMSLGLRTLRALSSALDLPALSARETLALVNSMFGDAPEIDRFAEWLHGLSAGNPLLVVEVARQLVDREQVRYQAGMWQLPIQKPDDYRNAQVDEVLSARIARLSPGALALAHGMGLARVEPSLALCRLIAAPLDERAVRTLLDELARCDVIQAEQQAYRFSSAALREVLLQRMTAQERAASHRVLGQALLALAGPDAMLRIEAGWHLIRGGSDVEGAELIDEVMKDPVVMRRLNADMQRLGAPLEAALEVYARHGRPVHARLALLSGLTHAGFFEDARYEAAYGGPTLAALAHLSGMRLARRLRVLGRFPALLIALTVAAVRYAFIPRHERPFGFVAMLLQLFGNVLACVAVAAIQLDGDRAARLSSILEPFSVLPSRLSARAIYRFCSGLQQVAREHQVQAFREFDEFVTLFADPRQFRLVPHDARLIFTCAAHFARGALAIFRDDGRAALESATVLETSGMRVYAMIGTQLRLLYHVYRGQFDEAARHRARLALHAAHFGSGWQVETWEPAALLPLYIGFDDVTGLARLADRLEQAARLAPSLHRFARLGRFAATGILGEAERGLLDVAEPEVAAETPRSFIGWSATVAVLARAHSELGQHVKARAWCDRVLVPLTDADREYVGLFLAVDLQTAIADAGLGRVDLSLARLDGLIDRFHASDNPLTLGRLHETRARIAYQAGRFDAYERSLAEVKRWFGASSAPALVGKYERLAALAQPAALPPGRTPANTNADPRGADVSDLDTDLFETKV